MSQTADLAWDMEFSDVADQASRVVIFQAPMGQVEREPGPAGDHEATEHAVGQVCRTGCGAERGGRYEPELAHQDASGPLRD